MIAQIRVAAGVALLVAAFCGGLHTMSRIRDAEQDKANALMLEQQQALSKKMAAEVAASRMEKDEALRTVNARLADALVRLRKRPERMPEPARQACEGATGGELSGPDAEVLSRIAAEADGQRAALSECYSWVDAVKH
jgi:hypothetical protein